MKPNKKHTAAIPTVRTDWIAVGDASRFILFEKKKGTAFAPIKSFENAKAHLSVSELPTDLKEHSVENMVREVTGFLDKAHNVHSFDRLILVANSRILGRVRSLLSKETLGTVFAEHEKDFAWIAGRELEDRVQALMALH